MSYPRTHFRDINTGGKWWRTVGPARTLCGRLVKTVSFVTDEHGPYPKKREICEACARRSHEGWEDTMRDLFRYGGSDEEREVFGKYFYCEDGR
jgi:hypothetical protein